MTNDPSQGGSDGQALFEQVSAILTMNGAQVDQEVVQHLVPLLAAHQEFEQNRAMLLSMLQALES